VARVRRHTGLLTLAVARFTSLYAPSFWQAPRPGERVSRSLVSGRVAAQARAGHRPGTARPRSPHQACARRRRAGSNRLSPLGRQMGYHAHSLPPV